MGDRESPQVLSQQRQPSLEELKTALEAQLDRQLGPRSVGCWPLFIALLGIALGVGLLLR